MKLTKDTLIEGRIIKKGVEIKLSEEYKYASPVLEDIVTDYMSDFNANYGARLLQAIIEVVEESESDITPEFLKAMGSPLSEMHAKKRDFYRGAMLVLDNFAKEYDL